MPGGKNKVTVNSEEIPLPSWSSVLRSFALKVLNEIKPYLPNNKPWELFILLCGDKTITALNKQYRNKNEPTDILCFNLGIEMDIPDKKRTVYQPGDIIISLDTLRENAKYFKTSEDEELRRLVIHGILHLAGMNHKTLNTDEPMLVLQEEILNKLQKTRII